MKHSNALIPTLVVSGVILSGCAAMSEQQRTTMARITGGVAGAVLGSAAAKHIDNDYLRTGVILAGAAAGAYIGDQFAKVLNERDRQQLFNAQQRAAASGRPASFTGDDGVRGRVSVVESKPQVKQQQVVEVKVLKDKVEQTPALDLVGAPYSPKSNLNMRGGPGQDYRIVGSIPAGTVVQVIGQVQGKPWYLVSQAADGTASGYSSSTNLYPSDKRVDVVDTGTQSVASVQVEAIRICKTVHQEVTTKDGTINDDIRVCQQGDGTWKIA